MTASHVQQPRDWPSPRLHNRYLAVPELWSCSHKIGGSKSQRFVLVWRKLVLLVQLCNWVRNMLLYILKFFNSSNGTFFFVSDLLQEWTHLLISTDIITAAPCCSRTQLLPSCRGTQLCCPHVIPHPLIDAPSSTLLDNDFNRNNLVVPGRSWLQTLVQRHVYKICVLRFCQTFLKPNGSK